MFSGDRLAELRKDRKLLQKELAEILGVTEQALGTYERGKHLPSVDVVYKIAKFFNISVDYLLELTAEEVSYDRSKSFDIPKDFPEEAIPTVKNVISTIAKVSKSK